MSGNDCYIIGSAQRLVLFCPTLSAASATGSSRDAQSLERFGTENIFSRFARTNAVGTTTLVRRSQCDVFS